MLEKVVHGSTPHPDALVYLLCSEDSLTLGLPNEVIQILNRPEFKQRPTHIFDIYDSSERRLIVVNCGSPQKINIDSIRKLGIKLGTYLSDCEMRCIHVFPDQSLNQHNIGKAFGIGLQMVTCSPRQMPGSQTNITQGIQVTIKSVSEIFDLGLAAGIDLGQSVNFARALVNTPPNIADPKWIARQAEDLCSQTKGLRCRIIEGAELEREQLVGLINVGKASKSPPCMIRLEWNPNPDSNKKPVILLGKTITYDTGGLSIKTKTGMPGMKHDKAGGCAVLGTMHAIAHFIQPDFPVVAILVVAENAISENGYRPDDVITYRNGVTVEVTNTDAEGRLVLADGLCWACEVEDPDCIIDIATLTGAVHGALGGVYAGIFGEQTAIVEEVVAAGVTSGEEVWRLPVNSSYRDMMKGTVADIVNSNHKAQGAASAAAAFLTYFCDESIPYAHIDMAGMSHSKSDEFAIDGPSGWGVRLLSEFVESRKRSN